MTEELALTYQTRITLDEEEDLILRDYAKYFSQIVRKLFACVMRGNLAASLKSDFIKRFGITARQFNACRVQLEGLMSSITQVNNQRITDLGMVLECLERRISELERKKRFKKLLYGKKMRYRRLQNKKECLERDKEEGRIRLCFGKRELFRRQFSSEISHEDWKKEWDFQRNREFFTLGSKDETSGNQTCTALIQDDGKLTLRLRLPDALDKGKYILIRDVHFAYGHDRVLQALERCLERKNLYREKNSYKGAGVALSYSFVRDKKCWRVFVSFSLPCPHWHSDKRLGVIGIDINVDHIALVETDRTGNPIYKESIPMNLYGKDKNQSSAILGDVCACIVKRALEKKKPIVVEALDFQKKKCFLREMDSRRARLLSSFAYSTFLGILRSRSYRNGIECFSVNPAFTSLIGRIKYAKRYGLTIHESAALCIGRRLQNYSEKLPLCSSVPDGKGRYIPFSIPVRNQRRSDIFFLKGVLRSLKAALGEHFWVIRYQSTDPPTKDLCDVQTSEIVGEIPAREPLAKLFG